MLGFLQMTLFLFPSSSKSVPLMQHYPFYVCIYTTKMFYITSHIIVTCMTGSRSSDNSQLALGIGFIRIVAAEHPTKKPDH